MAVLLSWKLLSVAFLCCLFSATVHGEIYQLNALFGQLASAKYPEPYEDNVDQTWNISIPSGFIIDLYFSLFQLEPSNDCEYDFVKVLSKAEEVATYCGNEALMANRMPGDVHLTSLDNNMVVRFHSDFSNEEPFLGFIAHYRAIDIDECSVENGGCQHLCHNFVSGYYCSCRRDYQLQPDDRTCKVFCRDQLYTHESDSFQTPDYPSDYPQNTDCNWSIRVESGFVINLFFDTFDVEYHPEVICPYDYVKVFYDGNELGPYCGSTIADRPPNIVTSGHSANITFHSDDSVQKSGFRVYYNVTARPCPVLSAPMHGFASGGQVTEGQSLAFSCKEGYLMNGSALRICQSDGTWSGIQPVCQIVTCDSPPVMSNGRILFFSGSNFSYTVSIGYECDTFYEVLGVNFRTCQSNGTWSYEDPICKPICGQSSIRPREPPGSRITGGREAMHGSWPWQVLIQIYAPLYDFVDETFCGGSLLNEEWILTAAHCVTGQFSVRPRFYGKRVPLDSVDVMLGLHKRSMLTEHTITSSVREIIKHPDYNPGNFDADIALIRLNGSINFSDYIRPICLPEQNTIPHGQDDSQVVLANVAIGDDTGVVIGWGKLGANTPTSNVLREVYVGVDVSRSECRQAMGDAVTHNMVCAGPREGGSDACRGDSGGPLMLKDATTQRYFPYGIVSWGDGCGDEGRFGVYTRTENFVDWIQAYIHTVQR